MAKIIGMNSGGGNTPPPQQPKIDLSKATEMECQECTGTPNDAIVPVELYLCGDCGEINQELLPKELQNKNV